MKPPMKTHKIIKKYALLFCDTVGENNAHKFDLCLTILLPCADFKTQDVFQVAGVLWRLVLW
jgi:hypothetical protein